MKTEILRTKIEKVVTVEAATAVQVTLTPEELATVVASVGVTSHPKRSRSVVVKQEHLDRKVTFYDELKDRYEELIAEGAYE
jgi:hypothetical protein